MHLYETHMHTYPVSACAVSTPEEMVRHYKRREYTGVIITDHFFNGNCGVAKKLPWADKVRYFTEAYKRAKAEGENCNLDVFFGLEYSYQGTDFLVYGLDETFLLANPGFDALGLNEFSTAVRGAGAYLAQAHPFRSAWWIANPEPTHPSLIDGIEVHNASMDAKTNARALRYAEEHGLAKQAGTDAHDTSAKRPSGIALNRRAETIFDIVAALKSGEISLLN